MIIHMRAVANQKKTMNESKGHGTRAPRMRGETLRRRDVSQAAKRRDDRMGARREKAKLLPT